MNYRVRPRLCENAAMREKGHGFPGCNTLYGITSGGNVPPDLLTINRTTGAVISSTATTLQFEASPRQQWHVLIRDHHEPYVSWERFERIQQQIQSNRRNVAGPGAPREGRALLQGLILCGQCGRRMRVLYNNRSAQLRYCCVRRQADVPSADPLAGPTLAAAA